MKYIIIKSLLPMVSIVVVFSFIFLNLLKFHSYTINVHIIQYFARPQGFGETCGLRVVFGAARERREIK